MRRHTRMAQGGTRMGRQCDFSCCLLCSFTVSSELCNTLMSEVVRDHIPDKMRVVRY